MDFKGKKIALLGFGHENQAMLSYLSSQGAILTICDKNSNLSTDQNAEYRLGEDYLQNLSDFDIIFRSPGVPYLTPEIQAAKKAGVEITSQTKLFFEKCPAKIIGITGTKGKGTTAGMIFDILQAAQKQKEINGEVYLVGNIGTPAITVLDKAAQDDWVVFELSSFQLQDLKKSPHIAVVLDITEDHLDHHKTTEEYMMSKKNIARYQKPEDFLVIAKVFAGAAAFAAATVAQKHYFTAKDLAANISLNVPGKHNLLNAAAAAAAAGLAGASEGSIKEGLKNFKGLPHRLELAAKKDGLKYYDDSFATTPDATIAAVKSFSEPVTLIVGGSSKGADFTDLIETIKNSSVVKVIHIGHEGERIKDLLRKAGGAPEILKGSNTMAEIVDMAKKNTPPGGVVLLSPAAASFDMFKDASDRGRQFQKAVLGS